jgi:predicted ATP-dependent endonuclease of OLD family
MILKQFHVTTFQGVLDSGPIEIDEITCLVGKNEAGKTALLKALYRLNPIRSEDSDFNVTDDYPRSEVSDYEDRVHNGEPHAAVILVVNELEPDEITAVENVFGPSFLKEGTLKITKYYDNHRTFYLSTDEPAAIAFLSRNLTPAIQTEVSNAKSAKEFAAALGSYATDAAVAPIIAMVRESAEHDFAWYAFNKILKQYEPHYLYFDEYYQMRGCENMQALQTRVTNKQLLPSDHPLLGLIELARLKLPDLVNPTRTQELKNKLQGAGNHLSKQILPYWSQNKHLHMSFDVRSALPGDPEGMRQDTNIWGEVYDMRHQVSTGLGSRSRGFVWFFSFVAWYSQIKRAGQNVILLLDEPGLTLHGRAQGDLLRYFEEQLKDNHQVIYSTHSPFMVDSTHFERVRIVQDLSIDRDDLPRDKQGTKVTRDILEATDDSLFPLQGALGYDIHQTLFIGPNSLLVEGAGDILFIQAMSTLLGREGGEALSDRWTLTPVGGSGRIPTFVRLLTGQKGMTVATLIDIQANDRATVEGLYKDKLLKKANVRTFADYTGTKEADIEDMFDPDFYLSLVNAEYGSAVSSPIKRTHLTSKAPRILVRLQEYLDSSNALTQPFSHYRPARYLHEKLGVLATQIPIQTKDRFAKAFGDLNKLLK